jgi:hypothetical protein
MDRMDRMGSACLLDGGIGAAAERVQAVYDGWTSGASATACADGVAHRLGAWPRQTQTEVCTPAILRGAWVQRDALALQRGEPHLWSSGVGWVPSRSDRTFRLRVHEGQRLMGSPRLLVVRGKVLVWFRPGERRSLQGCRSQRRVRAARARARIQNRMTTRVSGQPASSKW